MVRTIGGATSYEPSPIATVSYDVRVNVVRNETHNDRNV